MVPASLGIGPASRGLALCFSEYDVSDGILFAATVRVKYFTLVYFTYLTFPSSLGPALQGR